MNTLKAATDKELIHLFRAGQDNAFETLMMRHKDKVYTSILLLVKDIPLAEDFFQETFIKALQKIRDDQYNEEGKFLPWVLRIAHNLCMDYFRKSKKEYLFETGPQELDAYYDLPGNMPHPEKILTEKEDSFYLGKFIDLLPEDQKEVLLLRHYYEYSFIEIAKMTHTNVSTATGRMRYALKNLKKMIEQLEK